MADGKWIPGLTTSTSVAEAARRVLTARLEVVCRCLPLAVHAANSDIEHVHQLRVATRRTGAALRIFAACVPAKRLRSSRRRVRAIRRAAGAARDWDVFQQMLAEWEVKRPAAEQPGLDFLSGVVFARRTEAQSLLRGIADRAPDIAKIVEDLRAPDGQHHQTLAGLALPTLETLFNDLDAAISVEFSDYNQMHRVRILGKRLRYAMEIFADCFVSEFRTQWYPAVEEMQEILGAANDSHLAMLRLTELREYVKATRPADWRRFRPGVERLLQLHRRRLPQERRRFAKWLDRWRQQRVPLADLLVTSTLISEPA